MKKVSSIIILIALCLSFVSCGKDMSNDVSNNVTNDVSNNYSLNFVMFVEELNQLVGPDAMFLSMERTSTRQSYDNNYTSIYTLTSMYQNEYKVAIIYEGNSIKSIDIYGERAEISEGRYLLNIDYHTLVAKTYQILTEQTDAYGLLIDKFDINSQDAEITKIESTENWTMIYSANNERISFLFQLVTT